jgi:bilirubin oxidase
VNPDSDGYPEAWMLPAAKNIDCIGAPGYPRTPATSDDFFCRGSNFDQIPGSPAERGAAVFQYRNDQKATTLWYHDHSVGLTRTNVYAGPAGFYLIRGGSADLPSGVPGGLPGGPYEVPIVIQDRSFNADGSLFYPDSREFFDGYAGPYIGDPTVASDVSPLHNSEFFGNVMVVNGKAWPYLDVEPRKYRFRFLNGSDSRFLILEMRDRRRNLAFTQIGSDGGFLRAPARLEQLLVGLAERADVVVDFSRYEPGDVIRLHNVGPDEPFGGPFPESLAADPSTTGQVMEFRVVPLTHRDRSAIPALPHVNPLGHATRVRQVSLNEAESSLICVDSNNFYVGGVFPPGCSKKSAPLAPIMAQLGTIDPYTGLGIPLLWDSPITENPALGSTETWEISNFTEDAHPIHVHMVQFQVVNRQDATGAVRGPEAWETGFKDTVIAYPGEVTRIKARYDIPGLFVWHCHILSHEDNEMMRPYCVGDMRGCRP